MTNHDNAVIYKGDYNYTEEVYRNGFCIIRNFFNRTVVDEAREEILSLLERDLEARKKEDGSNKIRYDQKYYKTTLTPLMHTRLFPSCESKSLALMLDEMFRSSLIKQFISSVIGENYRLRVDLVRRSTGVDDTVDDFQLPHEWHRDTPGEFTFGIFFDDVVQNFSGGTGVIPGTHWEECDPRWDLLLSRNGRSTRQDYITGRLKNIPDKYYELAKKNQKLRDKFKLNATEILGRKGDIYFFFNDIWHGRFSNKSRKKLTMVRIGGFPTEYEFKDDISLPETINNLPSFLREKYSKEQYLNHNPNTVVNLIQNKYITSTDIDEAKREKEYILKRVDAEKGYSSNYFGILPNSINRAKNYASRLVNAFVRKKK